MRAYTRIALCRTLTLSGAGGNGVRSTSSYTVSFSRRRCGLCWRRRQYSGSWYVEEKGANNCRDQSEQRQPVQTSRETSSHVLHHPHIPRAEEPAEIADRIDPCDGGSGSRARQKH